MTRTFRSASVAGIRKIESQAGLGVEVCGKRLPRLIIVAKAGALLAVPSCLAASSAQSQSATSASPNYSIVKQFTPSRGNQQALGFENGTHIVGYDAGNGNGRIRIYSATGDLVSDLGLIPTGHTAELSWRNTDSRIYVANGGRANPTHVYRIDPSSGAIEHDYDFESLGNNGMVAVDNAGDNMKIFYGPVLPDNNYRVRSVDFDGTLGELFVIKRNLGVPQGLEVIGDRILYLYSKPWGDKSGNHNNFINVYSRSGALLETISLTALIDESQGLSVDPEDNTVYIGAKGPNAIYKLQPAFGTAHVLTSQFTFTVPSN